MGGSKLLINSFSKEMQKSGFVINMMGKGDLGLLKEGLE
jgi:hypothetical protein